MTIRRKMTMLISSMLTLIVLLSIVFIYSESSKILQSEAEKYMAAQLDRANENVALLLKTVVLETEKLSLEENVLAYFTHDLSQTASDDFLTDLMATKNAEDPLYFDLFLMSHDGIIVSAAMGEAVGVDISSRTYFKRAVKDQITNTSDIILSRADNTQIVITISPVQTSRGETVGYAGVAIYATYFSSFLNNFNVNDASEYIIVDSFDHIVSHPNKAKISSKFNYFGLDKSRLTDQQTIAFNGENYRLLQKDLGFNNWQILTYLKYDDIYSKSMELATSFMKIAVLVVFIAIGFSLYLTDFISRPIVEMTESLNKMIEDEESFHHRMMYQLPFDPSEKEHLMTPASLEPTEVSNFRKAVIGFKSALEQGAENFEVEYTKLKHYMDGLYRELETINRRNLDFIATLSHDIRTPLTLIKGYARGLESGEIKDSDMKKKFQSGIVNSVDDIEHLVYNVLDFAYEVDHPTSFDFKIYSLSDALKEITFELERLYEENSKIGFNIEISPYDQEWIMLDLMNIKRVVINLVNNSLKYTSDYDAIDVKLLGEDGGLYIEVFDKGIGIQKNEIDQIFDMFYRTEGSKDTKGYGLGLYIGQQIVKAHSSTLYCESEHKEWSKMYFRLPYFRQDNLSKDS